MQMITSLATTLGTIYWLGGILSAIAHPFLIGNPNEFGYPPPDC
jgi:hypothetical protein